VKEVFGFVKEKPIPSSAEEERVPAQRWRDPERDQRSDSLLTHYAPGVIYQNGTWVRGFAVKCE